MKHRDRSGESTSVRIRAARACACATSSIRSRVFMQHDPTSAVVPRTLAPRDGGQGEAQSPRREAARRCTRETSRCPGYLLGQSETRIRSIRGRRVISRDSTPWGGTPIDCPCRHRAIYGGPGDKFSSAIRTARCYGRLSPDSHFCPGSASPRPGRSTSAFLLPDSNLAGPRIGARRPESGLPSLGVPLPSPGALALEVLDDLERPPNDVGSGHANRPGQNSATHPVVDRLP